VICVNCKLYLPDNAKFCTSCGNKVVNGINELNTTTKITEKTLFKYDEDEKLRFK